jgi:hypothetical protein
MDTALTRLTNDDLIASLRSLVSRSNQLEADIIEHIQEVETRRLYLDCAFSSLFVFCTDALGFAEGAAFNRIEVARAARRIPQMLESLRRGEVHLTGLRLLAPHLTESNHAEVLLRAKGKSKRVIAEIVADLAPKPPVPNAIRKLPERKSKETPPRVVSLQGTVSPTTATTPPPVAAVQGDLLSSPASAPKVTDVPTPPSPRTYGIHFTASEALKDKLRQAQDLLQHQIPGGDLAQIVERGLDLLIAQVKKRRFGVGAKPRSGAATAAGRATRHVPAEVRRQIYTRDEGRCAFVDPHGRRCEETAGLEIDHLDGFARTGEHDPERMRLACGPHNSHAAEKMYGRTFMLRARSRRRPRPSQDREAAPPPVPSNSFRNEHTRE